MTQSGAGRPAVATVRTALAAVAATLEQTGTAMVTEVAGLSVVAGALRAQGLAGEAESLQAVVFSLFEHLQSHDVCRQQLEAADALLGEALGGPVAGV